MLVHTFSSGASAASWCRSPTRYAVCAECDMRTSTGPQISHGTSVYLPFNIAIRSLVPRTACTARVDIDPWAGGPGRYDGCDGGRGGRRVTQAALPRPRRPQQQQRFWRLSGTIRTAEPRIFALVPLARVSGVSGAWTSTAGMRREAARRLPRPTRRCFWPFWGGYQIPNVLLLSINGHVTRP